MTDWEKVFYIYNVTCPLCGIRTKVEVTGIKSFRTSGCEHEELLEIINQRGQAMFPTGWPFDSVAKS